MMQKDALKQIIVLTTSAFGLVAALAWNSAIQELFKRLFGQASGLISMFVYAVVVTIIAVVVTSKFGRMAKKLEDEEKQN